MRCLGPYVHKTPMVESATFDRLTGAHLHFKLENFQRTGSFKLRGALNKMLHLPLLPPGGIVAASAGNHAQGVALSASKKGIRAKIFMPAATPKAKVRATEAYGADVVLAGGSYQESYEAAAADCQASGAVLVHAFDDFEIMAGQGTVALEMLRQCPDLQTVLVPVGGGGLAAGTATCLKNIRPDIRVIGVQSERCPSVFNLFYHTGPVKSEHVGGLAEGILVKEAGRKTFPLIARYLDDLVTVSDNEIAQAMILMLERGKLLVEGAGAAAFAAALSGRSAIRGRHVGVIVSGGNVDLEMLPEVKKMAERCERAGSAE
ncbi:MULTISPECIES: threonine ammonia-lyase [unclassified Sporolactobacillus]|uniref:threonine ammonia-lyase n=1 Tax=unclassified Sporolactobacillus TaxID=2628533 RepID=UPI0023681CAF|nr:threonine/serine dehydratase [Sporolactobacillus sp. CQH2019]MDD9148303.1 threonine/serine dehydratase [Sporolactobacillus sp. CQH2019]